MSADESGSSEMYAASGVPVSMRDRARSLVETRLGRVELRRRLWHISPGFLPFVLLPIPHKDPVEPLLSVILVVVILTIALRSFFKYQLIRREQETTGRGIGSVFGYAGPILVTILLLPHHLEVGLAVLAVVAFGDGCATLGGMLIRGPKLPWNSRKTWAGSLCFLLIGLPMTALIYWGETHHPNAATPGVSFSLALQVTGCSVLLAAIAESIPSRINDNIRVGVTAAIALTTCHFYWVA